MSDNPQSQLTDADLLEAVRVIDLLASDPDALERWAELLLGANGGCPTEVSPFPPAWSALRSLSTGQFRKDDTLDPCGNVLPDGVWWYEGADPGYSVAVQLWGRTVQHTVPYRYFPGESGIRLALELKEILILMRETIPPEYFRRFAWGVDRLSQRVARDRRGANVPMKRIEGECRCAGRRRRG